MADETGVEALREAPLRQYFDLQFSLQHRSASRAVIEKKLDAIARLVSELRDTARPDQLGTDVPHQGFILFTLQSAIQNAIAVAIHVLPDEPASYGDAFILLAQRGIIPADCADRLKDLVAVRDAVTYDYLDIDLEEIRDAVQNRLDDLLTFVSLIRPLL